MNSDGKRTDFRPISDHDGLIERYKSKNLDGILELQNKTPVWNDETQSYVLNFHGRVTQVIFPQSFLFLYWYSYTLGLCEKFPNSAWIRYRLYYHAVWEGGRGYIHYGLQVYFVCIVNEVQNVLYFNENVGIAVIKQANCGINLFKRVNSKTNWYRNTSLTKIFL